MTRVFVYGDQTFEDPGEDFDNEHVRRALVSTFPELANAEIEEEEQEDGTVRVEFKKQYGVKGAQ